MSIHSIETQEIAPEQDRALDLALQQALRPPAVPGGFRARMLNAVLYESAQDLGARKHALDLEYGRARERLRSGYLRISRDALALIVVLAFAVGALANLVLPWLQIFLTIDMAVSAPILALLVGLCAGASVWWDRFRQ